MDTTMNRRELRRKAEILEDQARLARERALERGRGSGVEAGREVAVLERQARELSQRAYEVRRHAIGAETRAAIAALHRRAMEEALWQRGLDAGELNQTHPLTFTAFYDRLHDALLEGLERAVLQPDVEPWEPDDAEEARELREAEAEARAEAKLEMGREE